LEDKAERKITSLPATMFLGVKPLRC
jgi:hypothetical protein